MILSTFRTHRVNHLLTGSQACVLYGADRFAPEQERRLRGRVLTWANPVGVECQLFQLLPRWLLLFQVVQRKIYAAPRSVKVRAALVQSVSGA